MDINALRDEFAKVNAEANQALETVTKEKRDFTAEEKENQDKRFARLRSINQQVEQEKELAAMAFARGQVQEQSSRAQHEFEKNAPKGRKPFTALDEINDYCRNGLRDNFTLITTSGSSVMLPKEVLAPYQVRRNVNAYRKALALTGYMPLETNDTGQYTIPVWDDTTNVGDQPGENATSNTTADSVLTGSVTLNATLYESKCKWFSNTLINANGFDILGYVAPVLQKMLDKAEETQWTANLLAVSGAKSNSMASGSAVSYNDVLNIEHSLPVAYRSDAVWIISDGLYRILRGITDNYGRPIFDEQPATVFQESIHGKPVIVSDYMIAPLAGGPFSSSSSSGTAVTLGAFLSADAIKMRDVVPQRLTRYVNIPTFPDQTGYNLFANGDCQFVAAGVSLINQ